MAQIDDHIERVERYGFVRAQFPLAYRGHRLDILCNDAYRADDGRLLFDFSLYCKRCKIESNISGRFPADDDQQIDHVSNARVAVFAEFKNTECN